MTFHTLTNIFSRFDVATQYFLFMISSFLFNFIDPTLGIAQFWKTQNQKRTQREVKVLGLHAFPEYLA